MRYSIKYYTGTCLKNVTILYCKIKDMIFMESYIYLAKILEQQFHHSLIKQKCYQHSYITQFTDYNISETKIKLMMTLS